ncbi:MAG: CopG family transcriptional regulator [Hyphomicrobiaceae bacterium]|nr:MAG: CopG family transcriptional regulator [Hyphomicrobiaceae bacterium]
MKTYLAYVYKDPDSAFGVSFPDLPGCYGAGDTYDEAIANAKVSLREYAEAMDDDGKDMPAPRTHGDLAANATEKIEMAKAAFIIEVPLVFGGTSKRINVSLDAGILEVIDAFVKEAGTTRSAFLAEVAFAKIKESMRVVRAITKSKRRVRGNLVPA